MDRREFLKLAGLGITALSVPEIAQSSLLAQAKRPKKPNVLFIFSDQQRWDTLDCYGQPLSVTPNLDRMASQGVRFQYAFTPQPLCGPARTAIQTGRYASETGGSVNGVPLPPGKWLASRMSEAGYDAGYIGKWHLAGTGAKPVPPDRRGGYKDFWLASDALEGTSHGYDGHLYNADMGKVEFKGYRVDKVTDFAIDYLANRKSEKPFFLFLSFLEPHFQNDHHHFEGPAGSKEKYRSFQPPGDLVGKGGDWQAEYPDYLGCCNSLDHNVGRLRAELERLGIAEDTLIIYTSDHGCHFRTRNAEYKRSCHENSIRIPMIACGPGFSGGKVINELVSLIDVAPTILTAAGAKVPSEMRGRPLQQLANGKSAGWPQEVFVQISEDHVGRAVRTKKWKYEIALPKQSKAGNAYHPSHLYDLEKDPFENNDLVNDPAYEAVRKSLQGLLIKKMAEAGEPVPTIAARQDL